MLHFLKCVFLTFINLISVGEIEMEVMTFEDSLLGLAGLGLIVVAIWGTIKLIKWLKHRKKQ